MEDEEPPQKIRKTEHTSSEASHADTGVSKSAEYDIKPVQDATAKIAIPGKGPFMSGAILPTDGAQVEDEHSDQTKTGETASLSKKQLKRLRKKQEWEARRGERKLERKEKKKAKKEQKRIDAEAQGNGTEGAGSTTGPVKAQRARARRPKNALQLPVTILFDCSWESLMADREMVSLTGQLTRCYSDNAKSHIRAHLAVSSWGGRLKERFVTVLESNFEKWKGVRFREQDIAEVAEEAKTWMAPENHGGSLGAQFERLNEDEAVRNGEIVYLSSDAEETLTKLRPYSTYIIGGLVDKNRYKGVCYKKARENGIRTAKLPIGDYIQMASRKILAVNHVNEIMLKWLEYGDWARAFEEVIPKRKGAMLKDQHSETAHEAAVSDDEKDEEIRSLNDDSDSDEDQVILT